MDKQIHRNAHLLYIVIVGTVFFVLAVVFLFFPRSTYSELEKRDLATFPDAENLFKDSRQFTADISTWFSDTEPYRDIFMNASMQLRDAFRFRGFMDDEETVIFRPAAGGINPEDNMAATDMPDDFGGEAPLGGVDNDNVNAKVAAAGIIVVGSGANVRALMAYGGGEKSAMPYINTIEKFNREFPAQTLYAVVIPTSTEFYLPEKAASASKPQKPTLDYIKNVLSPDIRFVDVYGPLSMHTDEDIFLRTDHHWAPLGAYYAAQALAAKAGVPFKDLSSYDKHVVHGYVGSMYGYSKDIAVKNAPEDFVYHTPRGAGEKTTYTSFGLNKDYKITSERGPYQGSFFHHFKDGSGGAYCTFMGGDTHIVKVRTNAPNNRRLLIIKDSFGNPVPAYLFYSFQEVHVIDFRYFNKNLRNYVADNGITDIALVFNIFSACSGSAMGKLNNILHPGSYTAPATTEKTDDNEKEKDSEKETEPKETPAMETPCATPTETPDIQPVETPVETPVENPEE